MDSRFLFAGHLCCSANRSVSCAGWVAVTAVEGKQLQLRVHGPLGTGFGLRTPPLLPHVVNLKGERIRKSPAYKTITVSGLLTGGLSATGAERLQVKKKK